jgi:hypothetical protein
VQNRKTARKQGLIITTVEPALFPGGNLFQPGSTHNDHSRYYLVTAFPGGEDLGCGYCTALPEMLRCPSPFDQLHATYGGRRPGRAAWFLAWCRGAGSLGEISE